MYVYESHIGSFYADERLLESKDLYCEACCEFDNYVGKADTFAEAWNLVKDSLSVFATGGISVQHAYPALVSAFLEDAEAAGVTVPETYDGFCELSDAEILAEVEKITGKPVSIFRCSCRYGYSIYMADNADKAKEAYLWDCDRCKDKDSCPGIHITQHSVADVLNGKIKEING